MPTTMELAFRKAEEEKAAKARKKDDSSYSYTPPKSETFQELLSQHKSGLITDEEFEEMLLGKKPYSLYEQVFKKVWQNDRKRLR